jgi:hypothetical protein
MENEFKPSSWQQHPKDLAKEYERHDEAVHHMEATPDKPEEFSKRLVRRGVLDPETGLPTGNSKQLHMTHWTPSRSFMQNFDNIIWS